MATLMRWRPTGGQLLRRAAFGNVLARSVACCCPGGTPDCNDCDPADDDPDPMAPLPLNVVITGAIEVILDSLPRVAAVPGESWAYANTLVPLDVSCGDAAWTDVNIRVFCETATGLVKCTMSGGSAMCSLFSNTVTATDFDCDPFNAVFGYLTNELIVGGCPCGDNQAITVTVTE